MATLHEVLGLTNERAEQILQELRPEDDMVTKAFMMHRIVEVAEGKPTNEILFLGAILVWITQNT